MSNFRAYPRSLWPSRSAAGQAHLASGQTGAAAAVGSMPPLACRPSAGWSSDVSVCGRCRHSSAKAQRMTHAPAWLRGATLTITRRNCSQTTFRATVAARHCVGEDFRLRRRRAAPAPPSWGRRHRPAAHRHARGGGAGRTGVRTEAAAVVSRAPRQGVPGQRPACSSASAAPVSAACVSVISTVGMACR